MIDKLIENTANSTVNSYKDTLKYFYPSSNSKGFNEVNHARFFLNNLEKKYRCVTWLELPFRSKKEGNGYKANNLDGVALLLGPKENFMLLCESKRIYVGRKDQQKKSIETDLLRLKDNYRNIFETYTIENQHLKHMPMEIYAVALVQYWHLSDTGEGCESLESWFKNEIHTFPNLGKNDNPLPEWVTANCESTIKTWERETGKYKGQHDSFHILHGWSKLGRE